LRNLALRFTAPALCFAWLAQLGSKSVPDERTAVRVDVSCNLLMLGCGERLRLTLEKL